MTESQREGRRLVLERLRQDARLLASRFGLELRALDAEHPRVRRRYGVCFEDGTIRIRLHHARTGQLLRYSSLVDTLCHELAHLRHFDHGPRFQALYERILGYARRSGIYRPRPRPRRHPRPRPSGVVARVAAGPQRPRGPVQLDLFRGAS